MHYAILCYDQQDIISAWPKEKDDRVMAKLAAVEKKLADQGKLGPVARLMPTTQAKTLRKSGTRHITDGPFAETKEVLLGFFIVDCATYEEAIEAAQELARANEAEGCYEIRPLAVYKPAGSLA